MLHGQALSAVHRKRKSHVRQDGRAGQLQEYDSSVALLQECSNTSALHGPQGNWLADVVKI
jgi:hypothetical protein